MVCSSFIFYPQLVALVLLDIVHLNALQLASSHEQWRPGNSLKDSAVRDYTDSGIHLPSRLFATQKSQHSNNFHRQREEGVDGQPDAQRDGLNAVIDYFNEHHPKRDPGVHGLPDAQRDGIDAVKAWAKELIKDGEQKFAESNQARFKSPDTWANAVIYHVQADRFNNGDPSNDHVNVFWQQQIDEDYNQGDFIPEWRHGGDIQGIRDRLGYMADLNADTLWITPLLTNDGYYAGYCPTNPIMIDPGFGTNEEFRDMVREAHQLGIRVVMDVVVNHLCDPDSFRRDSHYKGQFMTYPLTKCTDKLHEMYWSGDPQYETEEQGVLHFSKNFFPPLKSQHFFNRCGTLDDAQMRGAGTATTFGDFDAGYFDFNTRNPDFQEIFTDLMKFWIAYADVDAFRLDAAKHVTEDFTAYFSTELRAYANSLGKDNFFTVGEIATTDWAPLMVGRMKSDPANPVFAKDVPRGLTNRLKTLKDTYLQHSKFPFPGLNGCYHFEESGKVVETILALDKIPGRATSSDDIEAYLHSEEHDTLLKQLHFDGGSFVDAEKTLWTNTELHDWPRILEQHPQQLNVARATLIWLFTVLGTPVLYAGQEQGLNGRCPESISPWGNTNMSSVREYCPLEGKPYKWFSGRADPHKRQDFFLGGPWRLGSAIESVSSHAYVGPSRMATTEKKPWQMDEMLPRGHVLYRTARAFGALRKSCPALVHGSMKMRQTYSVSGGFFTFSRLLFDEEIIVIVQTVGNGPDFPHALTQVKIDSGINARGGVRYLNVFNTLEVGLTKMQDGEAYLVFQGPRNLQYNDGGAVFIREDLLLPFDDVLGVALCRPQDHS